MVLSFPITVNHIPGLPELAYRGGVGAYEGVVAHATDTYNDTADAERNYESGHFNDAFVHYFVDDTKILQCANPNFLCWGAGPVANPRFIQVELCQTYDAQKFTQAYQRYVYILAKTLADKHLGVTLGQTIFGHDDVSKLLGGTNHTDPYAYLASHGISKQQFLNDVSSNYNAMANAPAVSYPGHPITLNSLDHASVKLIQAKLGIPSDGVFGNQTLGAVKSFQSAHALTADGIVGPMSWKVMFG